MAPPGSTTRRTYRGLKRILDVSIASTVLLLTVVPMAAVAILILVTMGRPVIFAQKRPGLHGKAFRLVKFRTMTEARGADGAALPDAERLTRLGRFLRKTTLDELPTLWNVLKGEMSLVGPRPLLMEYLPLYDETQSRRHHVPPGLTGWAVVNGRNALSWDEKFRLDVWYVDHACLRLDLKILLLTFWKVLRSDDVAASGHVTMPRFTGTETPSDPNPSGRNEA